jgi:hypothetical protein
MSITQLSLRTALAVALTAWPAALHAQGSVVLTPFIGGSVFTNEPAPHSSLDRGSRPSLSITNGSYRDAITVGTFAGMHFSPRWELETLFSWTASRLEAREGLRSSSVVAQAYMYGAGVNYHLPRGGGVSPYVSLGVGGETWVYDIRNVPAQPHLMANVGGGIEFPLNDRAVFRVDLRGCVSLHRGARGAEPDAISHLMIAAGPSFAFPNP